MDTLSITKEADDFSAITAAPPFLFCRAKNFRVFASFLLAFLLRVNRVATVKVRRTNRTKLVVLRRSRLDVRESEKFHKHLRNFFRIVELAE